MWESVSVQFGQVIGKHVGQRYVSTVEHRGILYFAPDKDKLGDYPLDPLDFPEDLLIDVVQTGAAILNCGDFFSYCVRHGEGDNLSDSLFWKAGQDFFHEKSADANTITKALLAFIDKYGIPDWGFSQTITTPIPERYAHLQGLQMEQDANPEYMTLYYADKSDYQQDAIPVGSMALLLVDFHRIIMQGVSERYKLGNTALYFQYGGEGQPELSAQAFGLTACIHMANAVMLAGGKKAMRQCKQCGKYFVANDLRAEYCSKKCRGAYNSAMTRKRKKEQD